MLIQRCQCQDFQMAFKMCYIHEQLQSCGTFEVIHPNKIESEKNI